MDDLIAQSQKLKHQADRILKESRLVEILTTYGNPKITGSYPLDVMLRPDLDIYVLTQHHDVKKMTTVISTLIENHYFNEIDFADWLNYSRKGLIGYYLQPHTSLDGVDWKMDVWLIKENLYKPYTEEYIDLLRASPEKRKTILKIKNDLREGDKYIRGINGRKIYDAVLKHDIKNADGFKYFISKKNEQS